MRDESRAAELHGCLLDEPMIRWRCVADGELHRSSLPDLMAAMVANEVRDFPALRPHQRHPWHAFLTQLAVIALYRAGQPQVWLRADEWRQALLDLTPDDPDGAAWCLVTPQERPALLQPAVSGESVASWKNVLHAADELDMLVTSMNHDVKAARARLGEADDWLFSLVSLQTQAGSLGAGNYGVSRMNGGFASRPGVGVAMTGDWGQRWSADTRQLLANREQIVDAHGFTAEQGHALLWLQPWDGATSIDMASLDPFYIEVCRRVRMAVVKGRFTARVTGSKVARLAAKERNGVTGDAWTPLETTVGKALTVSAAGFDYRLMSELLSGDRFAHGAAWRFDGWSQEVRLEIVAQVTVRGKGKTEGFHERRIPVSTKLRRLLAGPQRMTVAEMAKQRIAAIAAVRKLLWGSLCLLFANGDGGDRNDSISDRAQRFARPFEQHEDARFFVDLTAEVEAEDGERSNRRVQWSLGLVDRAEAVLKEAFLAGPRCGMQRYKAQAAALSRFHAGLRGTKPVLPDLASHYAEQRAARAALPEGEQHG